MQLLYFRSLEYGNVATILTTHELRLMRKRQRITTTIWNLPAVALDCRFHVMNAVRCRMVAI